MMKESMIQVICGPGKGKSTSAMGRGISALAKGSNVIMVQFLKGSLDELCALISQARQAGIRLILTGNVYPDYLDACVDEVTKLQTRYE